MVHIMVQDGLCIGTLLHCNRARFIVLINSSRHFTSAVMKGETDEVLKVLSLSHVRARAQRIEVNCVNHYGTMGCLIGSQLEEKN